MTSPFEYDVALSFAGEDRGKVTPIADALRSYGISVFFDSFEQGRLWGKDLYQHLSNVYAKQSRFCVVFLSKAYAQKAWTNHELKSAQARAFRENEEYILPIRLDNTEMPGIQPTIAYIDYHSVTLDTIVELIREKLARAGSSSADVLPQTKSVKNPERKMASKYRPRLTTWFSDLMSGAAQSEVFDIAVCLTSDDVFLATPEEGPSLREACVVATDPKTHTIVAVGDEARRALDEDWQRTKAAFPIVDGVISDPEAAEALLRSCFTKLVGKHKRFRVIATLPAGATGIETRALREAIKAAGAKEVSLVEDSLAAAIGVGLAVNEPFCPAMIYSGRDFTEVALIARSQILYSRTIRVAGKEFNEAISQYIKRKYSILIGDRAAEDVKRKIGNAYPKEGEGVAEIKGRDDSGAMKTVMVSSAEVREALLEPVAAIIDSIRTTLQRCPVEFSSDLAERGFILAGSETLPGMDGLVAADTGFSGHVARNADTALVEGAVKAFSVLPFKPAAISKWS